MPDKIIVKDLLLRGIIGINDWERENQQDILINLTLFTDLRPAAQSDNIEDTLNYRTITKAIIAHVEQSSYYTVEALADALARICVRDHDADRAVVRVEKPGALRFAASVGVEIERERADYV
ncbi:MAG: dihydroneopterin aldolase [Chloroflexi bacterium]|nr:MAG: dihydroneopterin aldolase [Chloroflexota bacterium]